MNTVSVEELGAIFLLQTLDLDTDAWLTDMQAFGSQGYVFCFNYFFEHEQLMLKGIHRYHLAGGFLVIARSFLIILLIGKQYALRFPVR